MTDGTADVDVRHLARLVRLELTPDEEILFSTQIGDIVQFARQVQGVDTSTAPSPAVGSLPATLERPDIEAPCLTGGDALANAPSRSPDGSWFRVPKVIDS
jgi:aspartyl-tRNA(Asn)/glutamyl-tRNA(Gln) amidotransferase subunit C